MLKNDDHYLGFVTKETVYQLLSQAMNQPYSHLPTVRVTQ